MDIGVSLVQESRRVALRTEQIMRDTFSPAGIVVVIVIASEFLSAPIKPRAPALVQRYLDYDHDNDNEKVSKPAPQQQH